MKLHPVLSSLRRHKAGVVLISLQIALTLAIVCNAIFIIGQRIERLDRPTGIGEDNLIRISQTWIGAPSDDSPGATEKLDALQLADLDTLRRLPDVESVAASNSLPLQGAMWSAEISLTAESKKTGASAALYYGDENLPSTLRLKLVAGRTFNTGEIQHRTLRGKGMPPVIIVTQALASHLFPQGEALGKTVYIDGDPAAIVGIVERLQTPTLDTWGSAWAYNSVLQPIRLDGTSASYAVRTRPGRQEAVMKSARAALFAANPMRVMPATWGVQSFAQIRSKAYRADRGMAILMSVVCVILLSVTAAGIVGLTSFWVGQRHRQIGVRRALGARRVDILRYFQIENLFIAGGGIVLGVLLALLLNLWLMKHFELSRLPSPYVLVGVLVMLALGQLAVFVPARRASNVPPVVATRAA